MDSYTMNLLPSQKEAQILKKYKVGALFMEAGTGKTGAAWNIIKDISFDYCLWLTPFQTKSNLKKELSNWTEQEIDICGIESLSSSDRTFLSLLKKLKDAKNAVIIVDESLKIKNSKSIRTKRIIELGQLSNYRLLLNGTPLSKNLMDLWSQMFFLSPMILGMDEAEFKNTFCEYTKIVNNGKVKKEWIKKYHNIDYLYNLISPFVYDSKLEINKKKLYYEINYEISNKEEYERIKKDYLNIEKLQKMGSTFFLELCQKLQSSYSCADDKLKIIEKIADSKTLIYCKYVNTSNKLKALFPCSRVLTYGKHTYGLNLQSYNKTIFFDKTWDYAQREQVERRTYRQGQKNDCSYYDLTANCGLDKIISDNINKKEKLLHRFKEKVNQL